MSERSLSGLPPSGHAAPNAPGSYYPALDGVRGMAVLMVMVWHFVPACPVTKAALWEFLRRCLPLGPAGVDIFFVLSGFLITGILYDARGEPHALRAFFVRRVLRIFPLYYAALVLGCVVSPLVLGQPIPELARTWWYWTYFQDVGLTFSSTAHGLGLTHFWSLAVEEHFYLLWPFVVLFLSRRSILVTAVLMVLAAFASRGLLLAFGVNPYSLTPCRMDSLAIGGMLAVYLRDPWWAPRIAAFAKPALAVVLVITSPIWLPTSVGSSLFGRVARYSILAPASVALLAILVTSPADRLLGRLFSWAPLRDVGKYSYGIYVLHPFVFRAVEEGVRWTEARLGPAASQHPLALALIWAAAAFGATYIVAWLSFHLFEKRFLKLKRHFEYHNEAPRAQPDRSGPHFRTRGASPARAGRIDPNRLDVRG